MQRGSRFALVVVDTVLVLLVLFYGALILAVILRPWLDDMRGLLLGLSPADLVAFVAGLLCLIGVPVLFFRRRVSGIMWFCAIVAVEVSAAMRQFSSTQPYFDSNARIWLYVVLSLIALAIFVRFIYPGQRSATRTV